MRNPENYYADSIREFDFATKAFLGNVETGISVYDELDVGNGVSVITEKEIPFNSPEETKKNYIKVMEVRDMTEAEMDVANKFRLFFKKLFNVFFKGKKWVMAYSLFCATMIAFDIAVENYFGALIMFICIWVTTSPVKFMKSLKGLLTSKKKKEELRQEVLEMNLGGLEYIPEESIKMFVRPSNTN